MTAKRGETLVFAGPTLPAAEITAHGFTACPPVAVGDVLRLVYASARERKRRTIARIAIIDGYFERMAAVWHKELLLALERGIEVWGAASMGALRAAELAPYGMIGVGAVYQAFRAGTLVADDEVAIAHLPQEQGYRAISDALVNLRHGLDLAVRGRVITARTHARLVELARAPFYRERSWSRLVEDGHGAGLPRAQLEALAALPKPDRKAQDAHLLLRRLATGRVCTPRTIAVPRTWALAMLSRSLG